jgi:hypothetical protein
MTYGSFDGCVVASFILTLVTLVLVSVGLMIFFAS